MPQLCLIAAVAKNGIIGQGNRLPWHLPEDLRHFKALTTGHSVVMGRLTYESLPKRLANRRMVVISKTLEPYSSVHDGVEIYQSWQAAYARINNAEKIFIIGGASLYREALNFVDCIYLTEIQENFEGDVAFPSFPLSTETWKEVACEALISKNGLAYKIVTYCRVGVNVAICVKI